MGDGGIMNIPISVGDLVWVARPCPHCGDIDNLGEVFRVQWTGYTNGRLDCCGRRVAELCADSEPDGPDAWRVSVLRRFNSGAVEEIGKALRDPEVTMKSTQGKVVQARSQELS